MIKSFSRKNMKAIIALLLSAVLLLALLPALSYGDELQDQMDQLNSDKAAATERRKAAQNKVERLKEEQAMAIEEKLAMEERNAMITEEIRLITEEINLYNKMIEAKEREVEAARTREEQQLERYRVRIRAMEENGTSHTILSILLNCDSFTDLLSALDDYGDVMDSDKTLYNMLIDAREDLERIEAEYVAYKEECEEKKAQLDADKAELEAQIAESEKLIEEYAERIRIAEEEQKAMEAAEAAAAAAAASFMADYYRMQQQLLQQQQPPSGGGASDAGTGGTDTGAPGGDTGAGSGGDSGSSGYIPPAGGTGTYVWPFPGHKIITSVFGHRPSTGSYHTGVDIDGYQSMGDAIVAADGGTVIRATYSGGYGNCIIIDHGSGMATLYAHMSSMAVGVGTVVSQGQYIGGVGNTGTCYGADGIHLHFEVMVNGMQVDPLGYIGHHGYTLY